MNKNIIQDYLNNYENDEIHMNLTSKEKQRIKSSKSFQNYFSNLTSTKNKNISAIIKEAPVDIREHMQPENIELDLVQSKLKSFIHSRPPTSTHNKRDNSPINRLKEFNSLLNGNFYDNKNKNKQVTRAKTPTNFSRKNIKEKVKDSETPNQINQNKTLLILNSNIRKESTKLDLDTSKDQIKNSKRLNLQNLSIGRIDLNQQSAKSNNSRNSSRNRDQSMTIKVRQMEDDIASLNLLVSSRAGLNKDSGPKQVKSLSTVQQERKSYIVTKIKYELESLASFNQRCPKQFLDTFQNIQNHFTNFHDQSNRQKTSQINYLMKNEELLMQFSQCIFKIIDNNEDELINFKDQRLSAYLNNPNLSLTKIRENQLTYKFKAKNNYKISISEFQLIVKTQLNDIATDFYNNKKSQ